MTIDALLDQVTISALDNRQPFVISQDWTQGRTVYGGLSASLLFKACRCQVAAARLPRALHISFVGPLFADQPFYISVEKIREGKNVSQIQARILQDDKICVLAQSCFAENRASEIKVNQKEKHAITAPTDGIDIQCMSSDLPAFLQHFQLTVNDGGKPYSAAATSHYHGWMRYRDTPETMSLEHLVGIIDAWPPAPLQMFAGYKPASTIAWQLEFLPTQHALQANDYLAYKADTRHANFGYANTEATIWNTHEEVVALSRQTVAVFT